MTLSRVLVLVVVLSALPLTSGPVVAQEDPETADEYFNTLRSMEGLAVYEEYGELATIHSRALTDIQVGEFTQADRRELDAVIGLIRSFTRANERVQNDEYEASFEAAANIEENISNLQEYDETYSVLATLALTRYYEALGNELATEADTVNRTSVEIQLRKMAATAYQRANEPGRAGEFIRQSENLSATYDADRQFMNETAAKGQSFLEDCDSCASPIGAITTQGVDVFTKYDTAESYHTDALEAATRAEDHGLEDRAETFANLATSTGEAWRSLGIGAAVLMITYGLGMAVIVSVAVSRIYVWKRDYLAARLDSVVAMGDING